MPKNIPPAGMIDATADHTIAMIPGKFYEWNCTLNAQYEVARGTGYTIEDAKAAFFNLLRDRVGATMIALGVSGGPRVTNPPSVSSGGDGRLDNGTMKAAVIPVSFTMTEPSIYGMETARFSCVYSVTGASLARMLGASGLWRPVPGSDWQLWAASVAPAIRPRGHAQLIFSPGNDSIVDLGLVQPVDVDLSTGAGRAGSGLLAIPSGTFPDVRPEASWLGWKDSLYLEVSNNVVPVVTLTRAERKAASDLFGNMWGGSVAAVVAPPLFNNALPPPPGLPTGDDPFFTASPAEAKDTGGDVQRRKQTAYLIYEGTASRVGYGIPCPSLLLWGKTKLVPANRKEKGEGFWVSAIGDVGFPVYGARWKLRYFVPEVPTDPLPVPANPFSRY